MRRSWGDGSQLLATPLSSFFFFASSAKHLTGRKHSAMLAWMLAGKKQSCRPVPPAPLVLGIWPLEDGEFE
jgi:hypothetical protein